MSEPRHIVMVHPEDVNLADVKAEAAKYDATVIGNRFCPRGRVYLFDPAVARWAHPADTEGDPDA